MGIALTIGIMLTLLGFIWYMRDEGPWTILDDIPSHVYIFIGVIILINCFIHFLIS